MLSRKAASIANFNYFYSSTLFGGSRHLAAHLRNLPFLPCATSNFNFSLLTNQQVKTVDKQTKFTNKTSLTNISTRGMSDV